MNNEHPITPPPKLVGEWLCNDGYPWDPSANAVITITRNRLSNVAAKAARWGADLELDACCEWLEKGPYGFSIAATAPCMPKRLRADRRPNPPSLKEQALLALEGLGHMDQFPCEHNYNIIRRALEQLND